MNMNVDPLLQEVLDHHIKIASATFAKEEDRQTLIDTALLTFAGLGLAELAKDETGRTVWIQSERLMEKSRSGPIDLSQFMEPPPIRQEQPKMTQSLRLIMDDITKVGQEKLEESHDQANSLPEHDTRHFQERLSTLVAHQVC
jgi:hypothetical protein